MVDEADNHTQNEAKQDISAETEAQMRTHAAKITDIFNTVNAKTPIFNLNTRIRDGVTRENLFNTPFEELVQATGLFEKGMIINKDELLQALDRLPDKKLRQRVQNEEWDQISVNKLSKLEKHLHKNHPDIYRVLREGAQLAGKTAQQEGKSYREGYRTEMTTQITTLYEKGRFYFQEHIDKGQPSGKIVVPGKKLAPQDYVSRIHDNLHEELGIEEGALKPPGTPEEWAFIVFLHEVEHLSGHGQNEIKQFLYNFADALNDRTDLAQALTDRIILTSFGNMREVESDLAIATAIEKVIDEEVVQYFSALRILSEDSNHMKYALLQAKLIDAGEISNMACTGTTYDTGFHLDEYIQTGEIPNYLEVATNTGAFYLETAQFYRTTIKDTIGDDGLERALYKPNREQRTIASSAQMGIVESAMQQDPPIYSPVEMHVAGRYLENMTRLGIKATPMQDHIMQVKTEIQHTQDIQAPSAPSLHVGSDLNQP